MANLTVSVFGWNGQQRPAHKCVICGDRFKIRRKRKYPTLCGHCSRSFAMTNEMRKRRGQQPLTINDYRCGQIAKRIYAFLTNH